MPHSAFRIPHSAFRIPHSSAKTHRWAAFPGNDRVGGMIHVSGGAVTKSWQRRTVSKRRSNALEEQFDENQSTQATLRRRLANYLEYGVDGPIKRVTDPSSLKSAIAEECPQIEVVGTISELESFKLPVGCRMSGVGAAAALRFKDGQPGLLLSADNTVTALRLETDDTQVALGLADDADDLGLMTITDIKTIGRVHLAGSRAKGGHLTLGNIHVERADARLATHRPTGFGVEVLLGGLSIYNFSKDSASKWTLEARNLSGGSKDEPLRGSGVFVFGGWSVPLDADISSAPAPTQPGGMIELRLLTTGEVHSDGGIPKGIGDLITGGVFVGSGVAAAEIINDGATITYGANDMVLDNWGKVERWTAIGAVTSHGSSGIGFVNFGDIDTLDVQGPIETHGIGARGFNLYDGSLKRAAFHSITTFGDGAIGVQLAKPFGQISIEHDVRTKGGAGNSLVRGKVVRLKAYAVSLKPGTSGDKITVGGQVIAENSSIADWDFETPSTSVALIEIGGQPLDRIKAGG